MRRGAVTPRSRSSGRADDASESKVARRGVNRLGHPRGRTVTAAVIGRAQIGPALDHLAWETQRELTGLDALRLLAADDRIDTRHGRAAAGRPIRRWSTVRGIPVCRPLPHVADHVVQAVAVGRECSDRGGASVAIECEVLRAETLPARCWPCNGRLAGNRHPRRTRSRAGRPGRRTPIPPRWGSPCLPNSRTRERPAMPRGSPGDRGGREATCLVRPGAASLRQERTTTTGTGHSGLPDPTAA